MLKKILIAFVIIVIAVAGIVFLISRKTAPIPENPSINTTTKTENNPATTTTEITNNTNKLKTFEECVAAGKKVLGEKPNRRCIVNDDLAYIEIETCTAPTGESMSFFDAQRAFERSQCSREGSPDKHYCNETTGTWWIDIVAYRKGCSPACVIDVITKKAEVNWRCTGAQP